MPSRGEFPWGSRLKDFRACPDRRSRSAVALSRGGRARYAPTDAAEITLGQRRRAFVLDQPRKLPRFGEIAPRRDTPEPDHS
ncbi:hypothetical protein MTO96_014430 [Rhipicephalus appendiculatus]